MVVSGARGSPSRHFLASSTSASTSASWILGVVIIRSVAEQTCPALKKHPAAMHLRARSRSASSSTMVGPFPPNSRSKGLPAPSLSDVLAGLGTPGKANRRRQRMLHDFVPHHRSRARSPG